MTTTNTRLIAAVERALAFMAAPGIEGWGLSNPDPELFDRIEVGQGGYCTSETCAHVSHDPAAPIYKLLPRDGWRLAWAGNSEELQDAWRQYAMMLPAGPDAAPRFFRLDYPLRFWAGLTEVDVDDVPAWRLAALAGRGPSVPAEEENTTEDSLICAGTAAIVTAREPETYDGAENYWLTCPCCGVEMTPSYPPLSIESERRSVVAVPAHRYGEGWHLPATSEPLTS